MSVSCQKNNIGACNLKSDSRRYCCSLLCVQHYHQLLMVHEHIFLVDKLSQMVFQIV